MKKLLWILKWSIKKRKFGDFTSNIDISKVHDRVDWVHSHYDENGLWW